MLEREQPAMSVLTVCPLVEALQDLLDLQGVPIREYAVVVLIDVQVDHELFEPPWITEFCLEVCAKTESHDDLEYGCWLSQPLGILILLELTFDEEQPTKLTPVC